jgi:hypothetical protein
LYAGLTGKKPDLRGKNTLADSKQAEIYRELDKAFPILDKPFGMNKIALSSLLIIANDSWTPPACDARVAAVLQTIVETGDFI